MTLISQRVSVTTTATALGSTDANGVEITVINRDAAISVDLGGPSITTGTGFELKPNESVTVNVGSGDALYGIAASGTVRVDVLENQNILPTRIG